MITPLLHANISGYIKVVMLSTTQETLLDSVRRNLIRDISQQLEIPIRNINNTIHGTIEDELRIFMFTYSIQKCDTYPLPHPTLIKNILGFCG